MSYQYPNEMFQVGGNIFKKIGAFFKKSKILSKIGSIVTPLVSIIPGIGPAAAGVIGAATAGAKLAGLGHTGRAPKVITKQQVHALSTGEGMRMLRSGGVSLAGLRSRYRNPPSNITPGQWRGLMDGRGHWAKGGTISFSIGTKKRRGRGPVLPGRGVTLPGRGVTLPGRGPVLPGRGVTLPGRGRGVTLAGKSGRGTKRGQVRKGSRRAYVRKAIVKRVKKKVCK